MTQTVCRIIADKSLQFSCIFLCLCLSYQHVSAQDVDFNRDVRPILSDKCYLCHGPDENNREADLRLDVRDEAIDIIEAGELLSRIADEDDDFRMPPPDSNLSLSAEEKKTLQRWVESGAAYDQHWAFKSIPNSVAVPVPTDDGWCHETIDRFVLAQLKRRKLVPNPPAADLRWLRRATLDLTGLPPAVKDIETFEKELDAFGRRVAYAQVVDRLLASPAYGEHMAIAWLDAARYADSYGYQSDKLNTQWPYRDWVVRAFNDNLPYNEFITWQLAGDLLENPTRDQQLATAFNRIHRLNNEGGAVFEEWRIENVADRVHTFGTAILGLTLECCRCHDHKYDPIPTRDYYSISAFFNSIDESGVYDRTQKVPCPSLLLPTKEQQDALDLANQQLRQTESDFQDAVLKSHERFESWKTQQHDDVNSVPDLRLALSFDRVFENSLKSIYHPSVSDRAWTQPTDLSPVLECSIPRLKAWLCADKPTESEDSKPLPRMAMSLDGERGITTHGITPFDRWTPFSFVITLRETVRSPQRSVIAHHTRGTDCGYNGWDLAIEDGYLETRLARVWPGNAIAVRTKAPIPVDTWHQIAMTYDGASRASGLRLYLNGIELESVVVRDSVKKQANVVVDHGGELVIGQRFRDRGLNGGLIDDVRVYERMLTVPELAHLATGEPLQPMIEYYVGAIDDSARGAASKLMAARKAVVMAEEAMNEVPIMQEAAEPRATYLLARGQYNAPKNEETRVERSTLSEITIPFPDDAPQDRLGLASWVTHPQHPLTSRVAVNRLWSNFFGSGLVRTPENFGLQGELPTHPELLDWLSRDFMNNGWDVKRLCRQIVLSATYRQNSRADQQALERDPDNRQLARGPSHRMSAEQIRDLALKASGLLDNARGGPPVSPYQPGEDLWRESNGMSPPYKQSVGKSLYRRSLYSIWKRTAPLPNMMALDATTREVCTVKRSRTNTPLQALVLMNDVQFIEAARWVAVNIISSTVEASRIPNAFLRLTGRRPDEREQRLLDDLLRDETEYFQDNPDKARQFIAIGDKKAVETEAVELAAWTSVCQAILNLDATVWKR